MPFISRTPRPPYYAVVFTSVNADVDHAEHVMMSERMLALAATYDGFLGIEPARNSDGSGGAVSYWRDRQMNIGRGVGPEECIAKQKGARDLVLALHDPHLQGRA